MLYDASGRKIRRLAGYVREYVVDKDAGGSAYAVSDVFEPAEEYLDEVCQWNTPSTKRPSKTP